ncbi:MAG: hypothetical protein V9E88_13250 [Ferruginibacter sp.]
MTSPLLRRDGVVAFANSIDRTDWNGAVAIFNLCSQGCADWKQTQSVYSEGAHHGGIVELTGNLDVDFLFSKPAFQ